MKSINKSKNTRKRKHKSIHKENISFDTAQISKYQPEIDKERDEDEKWMTTIKNIKTVIVPNPNAIDKYIYQSYNIFSNWTTNKTLFKYLEHIIYYSNIYKVVFPVLEFNMLGIPLTRKISPKLNITYPISTNMAYSYNFYLDKIEEELNNGFNRKNDKFDCVKGSVSYYKNSNITDALIVSYIDNDNPDNIEIYGYGFLSFENKNFFNTSHYNNELTLGYMCMRSGSKQKQNEYFKYMMSVLTEICWQIQVNKSWIRNPYSFMLPYLKDLGYYNYNLLYNEYETLALSDKNKYYKTYKANILFNYFKFNIGNKQQAFIR